MNTRRSGWDCLHIDAKIDGGVGQIPPLAPRQAAAGTSSSTPQPLADASHVSGGIAGYHHSERHKKILQQLFAGLAFRNSALAHMVRQEHGHLFAPPVPPSVLPVQTNTSDGAAGEFDGAESVRSSTADRVARKIFSSSLELSEDVSEAPSSANSSAVSPESSSYVVDDKCSAAGEGICEGSIRSCSPSAPGTGPSIVQSPVTPHEPSIGLPSRLWKWCLLGPKPGKADKTQSCPQGNVHPYL
eukprot:3667134-Pleurochrysis_carterae.AAC.1